MPSGPSDPARGMGRGYDPATPATVGYSMHRSTSVSSGHGSLRETCGLLSIYNHGAVGMDRGGGRGLSCGVWRRTRVTHPLSTVSRVEFELPRPAQI